MESNLNILSLNVAGLNNLIKRKRITNMLRQLATDSVSSGDPPDEETGKIFERDVLGKGLPCNL